MDVHVLGTIELTNGGSSPISVGGPRQRRILAALAMGHGSVVSIDRLVDVTWFGGPAPAHADRNIRTYIHRIRQAVGEDCADRFETSPPGYVLRLHAEELDADRFEARYAEAERLSERADHEAAIQRLDEALALWRGRPYAEFADEEWVRPAVARLEEAHVGARELRCESLLALDRSNTALPVLEALIEEYPLRERPRALYMRALHNSGRQAEALRAFQEFRTLLIDEAGVSPTDELVDLDRRIADGRVAMRSAPVLVRGYEVHELIGSGAFADVHRGTQPSLGREVAVKAIRSELANQPDFIRGFEAEASIVARLEHPHIVPLYDFWREPDRAYLVMRWLTGGSMEASLDEAPWPVERVATMVEQVGSALAFAHRAGVVHRDVKSANILLDDEGNAYLSDFGIAVEAFGPENPAAALSQGSPAYASPEQLRREQVGPPADTHGLAIATYEAFTGRLPFPDAHDKPSLLRRQLYEPIPPVSALRPDLPQSIDEVLAVATAKDPSERHATVDAFVEAFLGALADSPASTALIRVAAQRATEISGSVDNPYQGLEAFDESAADVFYGRARFVDELLDQLRADDRVANFLAVIGPSGSGKSSVVRAGLVPALRAGRLTGSSDWFVTFMTPGSHPFEALETALLRIAVNPPSSLLAQLCEDKRGVLRGIRRALPTDDAVAVLVIDQFEELFTLCHDEERRARFLEALHVAVTDSASPIKVIVTLRADFYDQPLRYPGFADLLKRHAVTVTPMAADELEQAIISPANSVGVVFEPGLVAEIVADVAAQPGALPLMQYALRELFDARVSGMVMVTAYRGLGGLAGALAGRADELYTALAEPEQVAARRLFVRLVTLGEGSEDTRRRMQRAELRIDPAVERVIDSYGAARMLAFDRDAATRAPTIEIVHEALIREWPRLKAWLDEDRAGLRVQRAITEGAARWLADGSQEADHLRGGRLESAVEYAADHDDELTETERRFVTASVEARDRDADRARRTNRRLRRLVASVSLVAVLALVAGIVAVVQQQEAADQRDAAAAAAIDAETAQGAAERARGTAEAVAFDAENARLGAEALNRVESDPRLAMLMAAEAHRRDGTPSTLAALQRTLLRSEIVYVGSDDLQYVGVDWSADGSRLVAAHTEGIEVYDGRTLELVWSAPSAAAVLDVRPLRGTSAGPMTAFDGQDDGRYAALGTVDGVTVFDLEDRTVSVLAHPDEVTALRFDHSGSSLATGDAAGTVRIWSLPAGTIEVQIDAHPESWSSLNDEVVERGGIDVNEFEAIYPGASEVTRRGVAAMAFSIDDRILITTETPTVKLWDVATGSPVRTVFPLLESVPRRGIPNVDGLGVLVVEGGFGLDPGDPDVAYAVTRNELLRFDWRSGGLVDRVALPTDQEDTNTTEAGADLTAPGTWTASLSDGRFRILDEAGSPVRTIRHRLPLPAAVAVSPLDDVAAVAGSGGVAVIPLDGSRVLADAVPKGPASGFITTSADSSIVVESGFVAGPTTMHVRGDDGRYREEPYPEDLVDKSGGVVSLAPDRTLYMVFDVSAELGALSIYAERDLGAARIPVEGVSIAHAVSPDGSLYTNQGSSAGVAINVWDTRTWTRVAELPDFDESGVRSMTFSPDGATLVATTSLGAHRRWRTDDWSEVPFDVDLGTVVLASFSPDGRFLATVDAEGVITLRDPETLAEIRTLVGAGVPIEAGSQMRWSDDGTVLLSKFDPDPRLWDTETGIQLGDPFPNDPTVRTESTVGLSLATLVDDVVLVWNTDPSTWGDVACRAAGRNMTRAEWEQVGPQGEPYQATCSMYPLG